MSEESIHQLNERISKLELLVSYLINDDKNIIYKFSEHDLKDGKYLYQDYKKNKRWIEPKGQIVFDISPGELLKLQYDDTSEERILQVNEKPEYSEYYYIEPKKCIDNIYNKINKIHQENLELFIKFEKSRIESKKQYITSEYERLKKQKEDKLKRQEELLYQKALVEAKIKARIVAEQKFLEEEALKELRAINYIEESKNPDLI
jgi:hypothetical protein